MRELHLDIRYFEVAGAVVARRCAESFRYLRRAVKSGDVILMASVQILEDLMKSDALRSVKEVIQKNILKIQQAKLH